MCVSGWLVVYNKIFLHHNGCNNKPPNTVIHNILTYIRGDILYNYWQYVTLKIYKNNINNNNKNKNKYLHYKTPLLQLTHTSSYAYGEYNTCLHFFFFFPYPGERETHLFIVVFKMYYTRCYCYYCSAVSVRWSSKAYWNGMVCGIVMFVYGL